MNLTSHFTLDEAQFSSTALRQGIKNEVPNSLMANVTTAAFGMEAVRALLNSGPIHIDSWYRCPVLNHAVGGSANSAHMQGYAVDFVCPAFGTPLQICQKIKDSTLVFDQVIQEGRWVHISFAPACRRSCLTAVFDSNGKATYKEGIA
jgi:hypothetical protein